MVFDQQRRGLAIDHVLRDHALADLALGGDLVHHVEHHLFKDGAEAPRASLLLNALRATATMALSVNFNFTFSNARSFSYCLRSAFLGSVRMRMSDFSSSSSSVAATGSRPTNSGISPYLSRSSGCTCDSRWLVRRSYLPLIAA